MPNEEKEHEERSHSARYLILIFLVCVATCGVFFSLGFLVGYNEKASHAAPSTEIVTAPPAIPPAVNPPAESASATQESAANHPAPNTTPDTEVVPPSEGGATPPAQGEKKGGTTPAGENPAAANPAPATPPPAPPAAGAVGEGITLQVVALRTQQDAEHVVEILKGKGYPVFLVTPEFARADDNLYRVQVGPFRTRADAEKTRDKLMEEGFKPFIKH